MSFPRRSGLLLHLTSLPGRYGIGDLGREARGFVDFLAAAGQSLWQILPLNPPAFGNSPYSTSSSFAWSSLLVSPELLVEQGWLEPKDLKDVPAFPLDRVEFEPAAQWKRQMLRRAYERFRNDASAEDRTRFEAFQSAQAEWLDDYAMYTVIKDAHGGREWTAWERSLAQREPDALKRLREEKADELEERKFRQYLFAVQWNTLHLYCCDKGVSLLGDVPIFVAHDSADVWANREIFQLREDGTLPVVAGVPPDAFSKTGQRWGNPLYRWDELKKNGYSWWLARLRSVLATVDMVRLDHFLGFLRAWAVPGEEQTALKGEWQQGPKADFFETLRREFGSMPLVVEDLGLLTAEAEALRDQFGLPGMRVLQFAFDAGPKNTHLPHNSPRNAVLYTGTHDNDTMRGWFQGRLGADGQPDGTGRYALRYARTGAEEIHWGMIELAASSVCDTVIAPVQDVLGLGSEARMNLPGAAEGNWSWRLLEGALTERHAQRLHDIANVYGRIPARPKPPAPAKR